MPVEVVVHFEVYNDSLAHTVQLVALEDLVVIVVVDVADVDVVGGVVLAVAIGDIGYDVAVLGYDVDLAVGGLLVVDVIVVAVVVVVGELGLS
mmetsp:Transcript_87152/g.130745  ORF Transcript_87152/g.130745 Transcript_87152/m.130745 type:complete len:93 (+) Transcript_87152:319-597(+)